MLKSCELSGEAEGSIYYAASIRFSINIIDLSPDRISGNDARHLAGPCPVWRFIARGNNAANAVRAKRM